MKHITSLLLCFICWLPLGISGTPENGPERVQNEFSCNLPGPSNLLASNIGATEFDLTWSSVPGAYGYRIEVTDPNNNTLYNNVIIGTSVTISNMPPSTTLTVKATTLCAVGDPGNASLLTLSTDIVIELIVGNYEGSCPVNPTNIGTKILQSQNSTSFDLKRNQYYIAEFRETILQDQIISTFFRVVILDDAFGLRGEMQQVELSSPGGDLTNDAGNQIPLQEIYYPFISYNINQNTQRLRMHVINNAGISDDQLEVKLIPSYLGHLFSFGITSCPKDEKSEERDIENNGLTTDNSNTNYEIYPNPFLDMLYIKNNNSFSTEITTISVFDMNSKCVFTTNTQDNLKINTSFFQSGMYFIRIENKEGVDIHKIIKS